MDNNGLHRALQQLDLPEEDTEQWVNDVMSERLM